MKQQGTQYSNFAVPVLQATTKSKETQIINIEYTHHCYIISQSKRHWSPKLEGGTKSKAVRGFFQDVTGDEGGSHFSPADRIRDSFLE